MSFFFVMQMFLFLLSFAYIVSSRNNIVVMQRYLDELSKLDQGQNIMDRLIYLEGEMKKLHIRITEGNNK